MTDITTDQVIKAFDEVVAFFWGKPREHINRKDKEWAQEWIDKGATIGICYIVFTRQLQKLFMSEEEVPISIGYLCESMGSAIDQVNGTSVQPWENDVSRWKNRVANFVKHSWWRDEWGEAPPNNPMIPRDVLRQHDWTQAAARASK